MQVIVLAKQVPDVMNIPADAWDMEKGVLRRGALDAVANPLDLQALGLALQIRANVPGGRIAVLSMGPSPARGMLEDFMARGADEAVLLTDMKFAGADTPATAYALAQAVRRIARDKFKGQEYVIVGGAQSPDGDTAQVPPQVAEELGIDHIAWASGMDKDADGRWRVMCAGGGGMQAVMPQRFPVLISVLNGFNVPARSLHRLRMAPEVVLWDAAAVDALPHRIGMKGSRTWVAGVTRVSERREGPCVCHTDVDALLDAVARDYGKVAVPAEEALPEKASLDGNALHNGDVWVYAQVGRDGMAVVVRELLGKARQLARQLRAGVGAVLAGDKVRSFVPELAAAGADKAYVTEHPLLGQDLLSVHKKAVADMVAAHRPQIMLFGATPWARALAPRVAYALGVGLTADCTALEIGDHGLLTAVLKQTRPALGGNIMATILSKDSFCQMATVRPGVFRADEAVAGRCADVIECPAFLDEALPALEIVRLPGEEARSPLSTASVIVAGGRGMASRACFEKHLGDLADALSDWLNIRVVIGASRMAVENGFIGHDHQVGQTGQNVAPRLYVAAGISGAVQHVTGIRHAGCVVAINRDADAPVFSRADHGMVGSCEDIIPRLVDAIRRRCA